MVAEIWASIISSFVEQLVALSNFHKDVELYHLCHNILIFEVRLCDQEYRMLSRDLKIY